LIGVAEWAVGGVVLLLFTRIHQPQAPAPGGPVVVKEKEIVLERLFPGE
jgi:hypothetical protein